MTVLFDADVPVHYGFMFLTGSDEHPDLGDTWAGQQNGLAGAAIPGVLSMITGLHTGRVPLRIEWHATAPEPGVGWEEIVDVPFTPPSVDMCVRSFQDSFDVRLPGTGPLRARYCAAGMDAARDVDTVMSGEPTVDRYLLQLWPDEEAAETIVRQTSAIAAYWHGVAREAPSAAEDTGDDAGENGDDGGQDGWGEGDQEDRYEAWAWSDRPPSDRLRQLRGNVLPVAQHHRDLLDVFDGWDPAVQRAAARWLARRAFEVAGMDEIGWVRPALTAMDRGEPLPEPFTSLEAVFPLLWTGFNGSGPVPFEASQGARHRPSFAVPALFAAVNDDPLEAVVDAFSHAEATCDGQAHDLLTDLRSRFPFRTDRRPLSARGTPLCHP
jgi:hypothetical protein